MSALRDYRIRAISLTCAFCTAGLLYLYDSMREILPNSLEYWSGGALYVTFWIFILFSIGSKRPGLLAISTLTTLATCLIEFSQLLHPTWLEEFRAYKIGYAILGTTFSWTDFPPYFLGGGLGYLGLLLIFILESRWKTKIT